MSQHTTPYPDVNALLREFLSDVQAILGDQFVGLYLYGSLASGDFDPERSDIDFVVVTTHALSDNIVAALEAMHARIASSGLKWAAKLEGTYIPQQALRRYAPQAPPCPSVNEGRFYLDRHASDWIIQRHILREQGVAVAGPALRPMIDPVQPDELRYAVVGILNEWWAPMLRGAGYGGGDNGDDGDHAARLDSGEYQAYAVLTMCRALYTLEHGRIVSKPVAARWAQATLGERWAALIAWALAWRHTAPEGAPDGAPSGRLDETLDLIRHTLERSRACSTPAAPTSPGPGRPPES